MSKKTRTIKPGSICRRSFSVDQKAINAESRTVEIAFSSETPYERYWGIEILDHSPGSVDLSRLKSAGAVLENHNIDSHIGVVESVRIDSKDRTGRAVVRFGKSARAEEVFQDVVDGIRSNVSVGYMVMRAVLEEEKKDGPDTYRITEWSPFEVSIVSVPADVTVGVGRAMNDDAGIEFIDQEPDPQKNNRSQPMEPNIEPNVEPTPAQQQRATEPQITPPSGPDPVVAERKRTADIIAIGKQYARYGGESLAPDFVTSGRSVDEFREALLERAGTEPAPVSAEIGLDKKETKRFSFMRALRALAAPHDQKMQEAAAFEFECSRAVGDKMHREAQGLFVPQEILTREFTVGAATGDQLVSTDLLSGDFISILRNAMVLSQLGVRTMSGLVGDVAIPRQTGGATTYWLAESGAPTESDQAIDQVPLTPKTVGAYTDISRKLLKQSSIDVESFVQGDLAIALGLAIEQSAINGTGAGNTPTGILNTVGIGDIPGGTNGLAPGWGHIVDLESDVAVANASVGSLAYLINAATRGKLKKTFVDAGSNAERVWDIRSPDSPLNGYRAAMTNAVPSNLSKGTGVNLSAIIHGNFADLLIGMWGALDLAVDRSSLSTSGGVRIVALQDVDVAVRHPESFSAMKDAITV